MITGRERRLRSRLIWRKGKMGKTKIEWATHSWNPIIGCSKCSPGCLNCYAERMAKRLKAIGASFYWIVVDKNGWNGSTVYTYQQLKIVKPSNIFVCSMSDLFHETATDEMIDSVFNTMRCNQHHTYLLLTKRPERMRDYIKKNINNLPLRLLCGVTACNQHEVNEKIPILCDVEVKTKFVSIEPIIGPISLRWMAVWKRADGSRTCLKSESVKYGGGSTDHLDGLRKLSWVIVGGESGPGSRYVSPQCIRSIRDECKEAGVPFMFKQWGEYGPVNGDNMAKMGKKHSGRMLDGKIHDEYPRIK